MNLSEIRAKYPQYDSISDDVLVQKLHDKYYPQMDINEFSSRVGYQTQQPRQLSAEELNTIRQKTDETNRRAGIDLSKKRLVNDTLDAFSKGVIGGTERLANGATFGAYDWMWDKTADITGVDALSPKKRREELEKDSNATKAINAGLDIVGGIPTGGALFKGLSAGAKAVPYAGKALKYLVPTASGAIQGGLYSGFENDSLGSAGTGALTGGLVSGALDLVGRGAGKLFSAVEKVKNTPRGFENAVGTKEGARILNRAVRESDDIAERVYGKAPEALDNLNVRAMDKLDDAVKGGVDVKGRMAGAKKAYGDFIDTNKAKEVILTPEQKALKGTVLIDKNGDYIPTYHGSPYSFDKFKQRNGDYNFSFSEDFARKYGETKGFDLGIDSDTKLYKTFLKTKKPFNFESEVDISDLSKKIGNKRINVYGREYTKEDFLNKIRGHYLKNSIPKEDFNLAKVGENFDMDNFKLNGPMKNFPILHKNNDYLVVAHPNDGFSYFRDKSVLDKIAKNNNNFMFKGDTKDIGNVKLTKIYNPDSAKLMTDADNWLYLEGSRVGKDRKPLMDLIKESGYDSVYKRENGQRNISVFSPKQIIMNTENIKNPPKVSDLGIKGLTDNQKSWLNQAWTSGKRNTLEKAGSLGHLDEMSKELNKMVQGSRLANPTGVGTIATPETVALQGLKDKVDDVIEKAGLQNIKSQYRQAKALEDSFSQGLNFNPNSVKTRNITFKTPDEQSAFAQGLVEKVKMNPESKNIAGKTRDLRGALRKALGEKADGVFKEMDNINKSYKNVEKVLGNAERKLSVPEPINGKIGLLREFVESPGSVIGGLADFARRWGTAKSAERAAKYLLDPTLKLGNSPYEAIRQYTPTIGGLGIGNLIRKGE